MGAWGCGGGTSHDQRPWVLAGEFVVAVAALLVFLLLPRVFAQLDVTRLANLTTVIALCAAAAGATSAILSRMSAQLREEPQSACLCLALLVYSFIAIPAATIGVASRWDQAAVGNIRLFAHTAFVVLIFLMAVEPELPRWFSVTTGMATALAATTVLGWLGEIYPNASLDVTTSPIARWGLTVFWLAGPLVVITSALRQRAHARYRIGLGLEIVAIAHALRANQGDPRAAFGLSFSFLRLLGVLLLLGVAVAVARRCLSIADRETSERRQLLYQAQVQLQRARERDHELRNGLAGLAGAANYIDNGGDRSGALQRAMTSELARLNAMMRPPTEHRGLYLASSTGNRRYSVEEILHQQITLRRSAGMDIRLDCDPRLIALGSPTTLAQVMSNLLANCERHAPDSPVRIQACEAGSVIRIRVTDFGPGLPAGTDHSLFEPGARGADSAGEGVGLHICLRLLQRDHGTIAFAPRRPDRPGATVMVELPLVNDVFHDVQPTASAVAQLQQQAS